MHPIQLRILHEDLMNEISSEVQYFNSTHNVQINPIYFEGDKLIPILERKFPDDLN